MENYKNCCTQNPKFVQISQVNCPPCHFQASILIPTVPVAARLGGCWVWVRGVAQCWNIIWVRVRMCAAPQLRLDGGGWTRQRTAVERTRRAAQCAPLHTVARVLPSHWPDLATTATVSPASAGPWPVTSDQWRQGSRGGDEPRLLCVWSVVSSEHQNTGTLTWFVFSTGLLQSLSPPPL